MSIETQFRPSFESEASPITTGVAFTIDMTQHPMSKFSLQVKGVGAAATTWDVKLEASQNGVNYDTTTAILAHANAQGDGNVVFVVDKPARYVQARVATLTLSPATAIKVTVLAMP